MATAPAKPPLHNFPPTFFKWGSRSTPPHRFRRSPSTPEPETATPKAEPKPEPEPPEGDKPWKLRPRRTTSTPAKEASEMTPEGSENLPKSARLREGGGGGAGCEKKRFWIALSKEEIEEDIFAITGSKPSRRPRKRPKNVQKQLDNVFPGLWLVGFSPETYQKMDFTPNR